jgi:hypothetical protein
MGCLLFYLQIVSRASHAPTGFVVVTKPGYNTNPVGAWLARDER